MAISHGSSFLMALLSPKDEDLHVNENSRKRKICLSYGAKGRRCVAEGKSGLNQILRSVATEHQPLLILILFLILILTLFFILTRLR